MSMIRMAKELGSIAARRSVWIPAIVLAILTVVCWSTSVDLALVRPFYSPAGSSPDTRWLLGQVYPWKFLYDWGVYPAWALGCGGLAAWLLSFGRPKWRRWRNPGLFFALLLIILDWWAWPGK